MAEDSMQNDSPDTHRRRPPDRDASAGAIIARVLVAISLWALLIALMFHYFNATRFLLLGGLGAMAVAATLQPLADRLPGPRGLRAMAAVALFLVVLVALLGGLGVSLYGPISDSLKQWPEIREGINKQLESIAASVGANGQLTVAELRDIAGRLLTGGSLSRWVGSVAGGALSALLAILVVIIGAMYLLARPDGSLAGKAVRLLPAPRQRPTMDALDDLRPQLRWWLIGTAFSMAVIGLVFGLGYWLIGLEFAVPLALFAAVAQTVPTFGPMVTLLLSLLIAATQGAVQIAGVFGVYVVVQSLESYLLTPLVMRQAVRIPPIVTMFTIILWGNVFGVAGLILAIPLDLVIWAVLKHHILETHAETAASDRGDEGRYDRPAQQEDESKNDTRSTHQQDGRRRRRPHDDGAAAAARSETYTDKE